MIDYIFGPPSLLKVLPRASLRIVRTPADMSDHNLMGITLELGAEDRTNELHQMTEHFANSDLEKIVLPKDDETWKAINQEFASREDVKNLCKRLQTEALTSSPSLEQAQELVNTAATGITKAIVEIFREYRLMKPRSFTADGGQPSSQCQIQCTS